VNPATQVREGSSSLPVLSTLIVSGDPTLWHLPKASVTITNVPGMLFPVLYYGNNRGQTGGSDDGNAEALLPLGDRNGKLSAHRGML
jgi:hypothetical protein